MTPLAQGQAVQDNPQRYDATLARFIQPDTIVPEPGNPQALNRYSYVYNNPVRYIDQTGNDPREPRKGDTAWSYILWEMDTNARSLRVTVIKAANVGGDGSLLLGLVGLMPGGVCKGIGYKLWYDRVRYEGDWDHKPVLQDRFGPTQRLPTGDVAQFDVWSNIHYGFVGTQAMFTPPELLGAAGAAQLMHSLKTNDENYKAALWKTIGPHTFFDWPEDQRAILLGIYLWWEYGLALTEEQLLKELAAWGLTQPPEQVQEGSNAN